MYRYKKRWILFHLSSNADKIIKLIKKKISRVAAVFAGKAFANPSSFEMKLVSKEESGRKKKKLYNQSLGDGNQNIRLGKTHKKK